MAHQSADVTELLQASGEASLEKATKKAQEETDRLFNVTLNIGVTGESGVGKSTFINTIRRLDDENKDAAETGVTETTKVPTPYPHPQMPNVTFWDLPGIGTQKFKAKTYFKDVNLDRYDFFIIISASRFTENDIDLAKEIRKRKKLFYFVRSKIDIDIQNESRRWSMEMEMENALSKIRVNCQENLKGMGEPKIFLISCMDIHEFDFPNLVKTLMSKLPQHKRSALLQSLPVSSMAILEEKIKIFEMAAWTAAALSGTIAVAPVPGFSVACDAAILTAFFMRCYYAFGLDDKSLVKLSDRVNKPHLKSLKKSPLMLALASKSAIRLQLSSLARGSVVEYLCSLVPGVGSLLAAGIFTLTYKLLTSGLNELADAARVVLREAEIE